MTAGKTIRFIIAIAIFISCSHPVAGASELCRNVGVLSPRPTASLPVTAIEDVFIPFQEGNETLTGAFTRAQKRFLEMERQRAEHVPPLPPLSQEEAQLAFRKMVFRELNPQSSVGRGAGQGGLVFLDSPAFAGPLAGVKRLDGQPLFDPKVSGAGFVFDHHGPFFDPQYPERNTSMLLLNFIEKRLGDAPSQAGVSGLARDLGAVTTDNLGDGALAVWIRKNLSRVAADPQLRDFLRRMTHYEDFGVFGSAAERAAAGDPGRLKAIEAAQAMLDGYDRLLAEYDQHLKERSGGKQRLTSDRFAALTADE